MNGIDGTRSRGTVAGRCLRTGRLAVAGTVLLAGAILGVASPAYAITPVLPPDLNDQPVVVMMNCGGLSEAGARAAGYTIRNSAFASTAVIVVGGSGPDWIVGSAYNDILDGQGGDDLICGRDGNDDLRGLSGNDNIWGGAGTDVGNGGSGANTCDALTETQVSC